MVGRPESAWRAVFETSHIWVHVVGGLHVCLHVLGEHLNLVSLSRAVFAELVLGEWLKFGLDNFKDALGYCCGCFCRVICFLCTLVQLLGIRLWRSVAFFVSFVSKNMGQVHLVLSEHAARVFGMSLEGVVQQCCCLKSEPLFQEIGD